MATGLEVARHTAFTVGHLRAHVGALFIFSFVILSGTVVHNSALHIRDTTVTNLETPSQTHPGVCLLGGSRCCQVVNVRDV